MKKTRVDSGTSQSSLQKSHKWSKKTFCLPSVPQSRRCLCAVNSSGEGITQSEFTLVHVFLIPESGMSNGSGTQKGRHLLLQMPSFLCFVAEKDAPRKALRPNGFKVLCNLYFCFSSLFLGHFRTPHIDILTNPYANRCKKRPCISTALCLTSVV